MAQVPISMGIRQRGWVQQNAGTACIENVVLFAHHLSKARRKTESTQPSAHTIGSLSEHLRDHERDSTWTDVESLGVFLWIEAYHGFGRYITTFVNHGTTNSATFANCDFGKYDRLLYARIGLHSHVSEQ